jgi:hypothetical protein
LDENFDELRNKNKNSKNNNYIINPEIIKFQTSNSLSQIQAYQNITRSRNTNNNNNYHNNYHYSSSMNNNSINTNFNMNNKKRINSNLQSRYKNSSFLSKHNSRQKTYDYINNIKNNFRSKNKSNRININLLKTQNVEVILNQIKMLRPKIINRKSTKKNSENKRKKISIITRIK